MKTRKDGGLPHIFKPIGFWIAEGVALVGITLGILDVIGGPTWGDIVQSVVIIGLLVAAMSRDKVDDEMLLQIRLRSVFFAFCVVALSVALRPLTDMIRSIGPVTAGGAVLYMLLIYHASFIVTKRRIRREEHD